MFRQMWADSIDIATDTQQALDMVRGGDYDLVLSDMRRDTDDAGIKFLNCFRQKDKTTPVIFYIGKIDPTKGVPAQAFGITDRPDELLHLILDAFSRRSSQMR